MGFTIDMVAFDLQVFEDIVVKSLKEGEYNSIILENIEDLKKNEKICLFEDELNPYDHMFSGLKKVVDTFDSKFRTSSLGKNFAVFEGNIEKIDSKYKLPTNKHWGHENLCTLFEYMTLKYCSKYHINIGKRSNIGDFIKTHSENYNEFPLLSQNLEKLEYNESYYFLRFGEGITGFVDEKTTKKLSQDLQKLKYKEKGFHKLDMRGAKNITCLFEKAASDNLGVLAGIDLLLSVNNDRNGVSKLRFNSHISGDGCVNFDGE